MQISTCCFVPLDPEAGAEAFFFDFGGIFQSSTSRPIGAAIYVYICVFTSANLKSCLTRTNSPVPVPHNSNDDVHTVTPFNPDLKRCGSSFVHELCGST